MADPNDVIDITDAYDASFKAALHDVTLFTELVRGVIPELRGLGDGEIRRRLDLTPAEELVSDLGNEFRNIAGFGINTDLFFRVRISPDGEKERYHYLVVEGQINTSDRHTREVRRFIYLSFVASWEKGRVFKGDDYGDAMPATCTWLMFNPSKGERGTVVKAEYADGTFRSIALNLGESDTDDRVLGIMSTVFDKKLTPDEKRNILNDKYKTTVSDYLAKEMRNMNKFAEMYYNDMNVYKNEGIEKGFEKGRVVMCAELVKDAMSNGISVEEAMEYHHIPLNMRPAVRSYLETGTHEA